jgi:predicted P-loop ATPase
VFNDLKGERDQIWAEVYESYKSGAVDIYLPFEDIQALNERQEVYALSDPWQDTIAEYLEKKIPLDWYDKSKTERRIWLNNMELETVTCQTVRRNRVTVLEIWNECFQKDDVYLTNKDSSRINNAMKKMAEWEQKTGVRVGNAYNRGRGYIRIPF